MAQSPRAKVINEPAKKFAVVSYDESQFTGVNLRADASFDSESLRVLHDGLKVEIVGRVRKGFTPVVTPEGIKGFVSNDFLEK